jgi:hypothetical protein
VWAELVDRALARLAGGPILTFSVDGSAISAHRLVMRMIRENLAAGLALIAICEAAARLLGGLAESLSESWREDRAAVRDLVEQIMAVRLLPDAGANAMSIITARFDLAAYFHDHVRKSRDDNSHASLAALHRGALRWRRSSTPLPHVP